MHKVVSNMLTEFKHMNAAKRRFVIIASALSVLVMLFVFQQMTIPAITMGTPTECQIPEHTHDESCYELRLVCGYEEGEVIYLDESEQSTTAVADEDLPSLNNAPVSTTSAQSQNETTVVDDGLDAQSVETTQQSQTDTTEVETTEQAETTEVETTQATEQTTEVETTQVTEQTTVHHHTYECYESVLICPLPEHTHGEDCVLPTIHNVAAGVNCDVAGCKIGNRIVWKNPTPSNPFGDANNFSLFTFGDVDSFNDVEGAVAMGGNLHARHGGFSYDEGATNTSTGLVLPNMDVGLIFGGSEINLYQVDTNGNQVASGGVGNSDLAVSNGSIITKDSNQTLITTDGNTSHTGGDHAHYVTDADVAKYFADAKTAFTKQNAEMMTWSTTSPTNQPLGATVGECVIEPDKSASGTPENHYHLNGDNPFMNIFEIDADNFNDIDAGTPLYVNVPYGSYVIINVKGSGNIGNFTPKIYNKGTNGKYYTGSRITENPYRSQSQRTIMNFDPDITAVDITTSGYYLYCSVMAPNMTWEVGSKNNYVGVDGTVVFADVKGNGTASEVHYNPFIPWSSDKGIAVSKTGACICGQADCPFAEGNTNEFKVKLKMHNVSDFGVEDLIYEYEFEIKDGLTIKGLPSGEYEIEEEFFVKVGTGWVPFTDKYPTHSLASLTFNGKEGNVVIDDTVDKIDIVNNYEDRSKLTEISVEKYWVSNGMLIDSGTPTYVTVQLYQTTDPADTTNGTAYGDEVTLNTDNDWKYNWNQLPKSNESGQTYYYYVVETYIPTGYTVSYSENAPIASGTLVVTNTNDTVVTDKTKVKVNKVWKNDTEKVRPESVEVGLYQTGYFKESEGNTVTIDFYKSQPTAGTDDDVFIETVKYHGVNNELDFILDSTDIFTICNLTPANNIIGNNVTSVEDNCTITENGTGNYTTLDSGAYMSVHRTVKITNINSDVSLKVVTYYDIDTYSDYHGSQPTEVKGHGNYPMQDVLHEDVLYGSTVKLDASNNWSYDWANLPNEDSLGKFEYEVKELKVPLGYASVVTENETVNGVFTITNTFDETLLPDMVDIDVEKNWVDNDNASNSRPTEIKVDLYQKGAVEEEAGNTVTIEYYKDGFHGKPSLTQELVRTETISGVGETFAFTHTNDAGIGSGAELANAYAGTALIVHHENPNIDSKGGSTYAPMGWLYNPCRTSVTGISTDITIKVVTGYDYETNKSYEIPSIVVTDKGEVTGGTTIVDKDQIIQTVTITADAYGNWKHTFADLLEDDANDNPFVYYIKEQPVDGYTSTCVKDATGKFVITNTKEAEPEKVGLKVEKVWDDNNSTSRPTEIKVELVQSGYFSTGGGTVEPPIDPPAGGTEWVSGGNYSKDEQVTYNGKTYKALSDLTGDTGNPAENCWNWEVVADSSGGGDSGTTTPGDVTDWDTTKTYSIGDRVIYGGKIYEAQNANNFSGPSPTVSTWYWKEIGPAPAPQLAPRPVASTQPVKDGYEYKDVVTEITLNGANSWKHVFENLPTTDDSGEAFKYSINEIDVPEGYEVSYSEKDNLTPTSSVTITNTKKTGLLVEKVWDDDNNLKGERPADIQVQLYRKSMVKVADGTSPVSTGNTVTVEFYKEGNKQAQTLGIEHVKTETYTVANGTFSFTIDSSQFLTDNHLGTGGHRIGSMATISSNEGSASLTTSGVNANGNTFYKDDLGHYNSVAYTVLPVSVTGINGDITIKVVTYYDYNTYTSYVAPITNIVGASEQATQSVSTHEEEKIEKLDLITLDDSNSWSNLFEGLALNNSDGNPYTYYVEEVGIPSGYEVSYSSEVTSNSGTLTITNTKKVVEDFEMPETGGMGTTIFYTFGGLMLAIATFFIATRKRVR